MNNYCAFNKDHKCIKWTDYEITLLKLEAASELCHGNWIEIQRLYRLIEQLEGILKQSGIDIPSEY